MLKSRKSMELSITLIIVAVIGLIVLVVMIAIFGKESGKAASIIVECESRGGECWTLCKKGEVSIPKICPSESQVCCVPVKE